MKCPNCYGNDWRNQPKDEINFIRYIRYNPYKRFLSCWYCEDSGKVSFIKFISFYIKKILKIKVRDWKEICFELDETGLSYVIKKPAMYNKIKDKEIIK